MLLRSCTLTYVNDAVIGDLPAGLEPQNVEAAGLLGAEVAEG